MQNSMLKAQIKTRFNNKRNSKTFLMIAPVRPALQLRSHCSAHFRLEEKRLARINWKRTVAQSSSDLAAIVSAAWCLSIHCRIFYLFNERPSIALCIALCSIVRAGLIFYSRLGTGPRARLLTITFPTIAQCICETADIKRSRDFYHFPSMLWASPHTIVADIFVGVVFFPWCCWWSTLSSECCVRWHLTVYAYQCVGWDGMQTTQHTACCLWNSFVNSHKIGVAVLKDSNLFLHDNVPHSLRYWSVYIPQTIFGQIINTSTEHVPTAICSLAPSRARLCVSMFLYLYSWYFIVYFECCTEFSVRRFLKLG